MDIDVILKLLTVGGIPTLIAASFVWLVNTVGRAIVAELKGLRQDIRGLRQDFARLQGRLGIVPNAPPESEPPPPIALTTASAVAKGTT